eukprot:scaffold1376_cov257-Pinguiococcus_pyrenoidosus.AAC.31
MAKKSKATIASPAATPERKRFSFCPPYIAVLALLPLLVFSAVEIFSLFQKWKVHVTAIENKPSVPQSAPSIPVALERDGDAASTNGNAKIPKIPPPVHPIVKIGGEVEVKDWKVETAQNADFLREVVVRRRPVLLRNVPGQQWSTWTLEDLEFAVTAFKGVRYHRHGVFTLRNERDPGGMLDDGAEDAVETLSDLHPLSFRATADHSGGYLYWTQDAAVLNGSQLELRTGNVSTETWRHWAVKEAQLELGDLQDASIDDVIMPMLWMSHPGVVAQAHYDKSHNFVTQIFGSKRWLIFPPFQHFRLYQHPHLHPSYKQSQVNFSDPDLATFPQFEGVNALVATVEPGDVLYMPPYWFHYVESLELSLSLSVVSPSEEELILSEAYWRDLPFGNLEGPQERVLAARLYLLEFLSRVGGVKSPKWFADRLYHQRYAALYPETSLFMQERLGGFDCHLSEKDPLTGASLEDTVRNTIGTKALREAADFVAEGANDEAILPAIREQWAQNYVEEIARWAMGNPDDAIIFIKGCLSVDTKLKVPEQEEWVEGPEVIKLGENAMPGDWVDPAERRRQERRRKARERAAKGRPQRKQESK